MLSQQLVQKQTQKLVMTADLRQSIELLPLSTLELADKIQAELIDNPLLEEVFNPEKPKSPELYSVTEIRDKEKKELSKSSEANFQDMYNIEGPYRHDNEARDKNQSMIEASPLREKLSDHLMSQLRLLDITDEELEIGEILISMVDDHGFITTPLDEIAKEMNLNLKKLNKVIQFIHQLDPVGIGAANIQETLMIQASILKPDDNNLYILLKEHFKDLEKLDYKKISKSMKISEEKVEQIAKSIKKLEPYPATLYISKKTDYIIPDVVVKETDGEFTIHINDEWIPKISINKEYKNVLVKQCSPADKEFITTRVNSAQWLIRSINQRRQTLYRVMNSIIDFQIDFFKNGINDLKPLTLKDIADKLNMHESTISRITTNKYVQTSWGILELKWFFSSGLKSSEGGKESSKKIHDMIRTLVKEESEDNPLSDQDIVDIMGKRGIEIARRTVAKYRKILKILPSNRRKRIRDLKAS
ncbi:MAG: RNA polymerase factor sigma-54 [Leptospiraceae bacterium]|nr:RNA polymerase factor sigma-54 [Leptospiraceae bacterium]